VTTQHAIIWHADRTSCVQVASVNRANGTSTLACTPSSPSLLAQAQAAAPTQRLLKLHARPPTPNPWSKVMNDKLATVKSQDRGPTESRGAVQPAQPLSTQLAAFAAQRHHCMAGPSALSCRTNCEGGSLLGHHLHWHTHALLKQPTYTGYSSSSRKSSAKHRHSKQGPWVS
jgi:hypothetical protein